MLKRFISTNPQIWFTLPLRISLGIICMGHWGQKLFGLFGGKGLQATVMGFEKLGLSPGILWGTLAGCGEFFGGLLVLLGMATRLGALSILIVMVVATLKVHWGFFFLPRGMEYALALLGSSLSLFISGGGPLSVDSKISRRTG